MFEALQRYYYRIYDRVAPPFRPFFAASALVLGFTVIYATLMFVISVLVFNGRIGVDWAVLATIFSSFVVAELARGHVKYWFQSLTPYNLPIATALAGIVAGATYYWIASDVFQFGETSKVWISIRFFDAIPNTIAKYIGFGVAAYSIFFGIQWLFTDKSPSNWFR